VMLLRSCDDIDSILATGAESVPALAPSIIWASGAHGVPQVNAHYVFAMSRPSPLTTTALRCR
jgi:hypothetical protein